VESRAYRIDLVVEANDKRMAVECDGDRYHPLDKLGEDMERQAILERMGWVFSRIRGSEFFRDADRAMEPVFAKLESLEIVPLGEPAKDTPRPSHELTDRVIRRAQEVRVSWLPGDWDFQTSDAKPKSRISTGPPSWFSFCCAVSRISRRRASDSLVSEAAGAKAFRNSAVPNVTFGATSSAKNPSVACTSRLFFPPFCWPARL
jgi:REase_MTES_1575